MEFSDQALAGENNPSHPTGEEELRILNKQLREQADELRSLNQDLVNREARLRLSIETGRVGIWVWDATGSVHTLDWSQRLKEIFGLSADAEVSRELFLECVHPEDRERVDWTIMQSLSGVNDGFYNIEYRIVHPGDKSLHWVTAQGQAFFDASGQSIRFIGAVVDISDRKQVEEFTARLNLELEHRIADRTKDLEQINRSLSSEMQVRVDLEEKLRQSERHLKVAQQLSLTGSFSWFVSTGKIVWSEEAYRIHGYDTSIEPTVELARKRMHPDDLHIFDERVKNVPSEGVGFSFHHRFLMPDGKIKHVKIITRHVDEYLGQSVIVGAIMDVTEQKKAEEALRASEHLARGQLEALTNTLTALSKESEPEKFLESVLGMIGRQLGGHSLGVWQINENTGRAQLIADYEDDRLHFATQAEIDVSPQLDLGMQYHPIWAEFFRTGAHCLIADIDSDSVRVRFADVADEQFQDWSSDVVANTSPYLMAKTLYESKGIVATLVVPTFAAGKVTGLVSIRFQHKRAFHTEEIELARALSHQAMLAIQLVRLSRESRQAAVVAERNRLARDIHDTLAQSLTGVIVQLEAAEDAQALGLDEDAARHLERAGELAREGLREARRSVHALRPVVLAEKNLCAAISEMIAKMTMGTNLCAEFRSQGAPPPLPQEWEENLLRLGQEVLTNTLRHAHASHFKVLFVFDPQTLRLELRDDGCGFDPAKRYDGFGLVGIRERVESMGGELTVQSAPENGTAIFVVLPLMKYPPPLQV
jgi:PAS domain S-box-containing protein